MSEWYEWVEPFGPDDEPVYMRASRETLIAYTKDHALSIGKGHLYKDDQRALDDFIAVHWATECRPPDNL